MPDLNRVNLEEELLEHYQRCKRAADLALANMEMGEPGGAAGALLNATTSALKEIARLQTELYDAERVKQLGAALAAVLKSELNGEELLAKFERELANYGR